MIDVNPIFIKEYEEFPNPIYISEENFDEFKSYFSEYLDIEESWEPEEKRVKLRLKARYYIGILKFPNNQSYVILPKIENANFLKMLEYVEPKFTNIIEDILQNVNPNSNFLDLFIEKFLQLTEVLFRTFLRKNYQPISKETESLKGKIILSETLKNSNFLRGKIICGFDDFTLDVLENQVIKYALHLLRFIANDGQQYRIRQLLVNLESVTLKEFRTLNLVKFRYNRFNSRYKTVHLYCKMIIERFSFGFNIGAFNCFSLLLNSWDIYEKFLRKILEIYLNKSISADLKIKKNLSEFESWNKHKYIPDVVIYRDNVILLICDAKYKLKHTVDDRRQGIDYVRELIKKHKREELVFDIKNRNCILIYPSNNYDFDLLESDPQQDMGIIYAHSIDLSQVDNESYLESWVLNFVEKFF